MKIVATGLCAQRRVKLKGPAQAGPLRHAEYEAGEAVAPYYRPDLNAVARSVPERTSWLGA